MVPRSYIEGVLGRSKVNRTTCAGRRSVSNSKNSLKRHCCGATHRITLRPGMSNVDFTGLKGVVVVCGRCKGLVEAKVGDEYQHGRAHVRVVRDCGRVVATASYSS
jgi:hypothetical protein